MSFRLKISDWKWIALGGCLLVTIALLAAIAWKQAAAEAAIAPRVAADFTLIDHHGAPFHLADARGKVVLLYFGFTFCPDVCPTELAFIGRLMRALGPAASEVQPLFITLDPQRDTQEKLAGYAPFFHPSVRALRGGEEQIATIARQYGIAAERSVPPGSPAGYYLIDHTSAVLVLDRSGQIVDRLDATVPVPVAFGRIRRLLP